jgi:hypothetical protein
LAADLRPSDRLWFKRCRRSWAFGSRLRRSLEPAERPYRLDLDRAVRDGLAVYYFPGMWEWDRTVVRPLAFAAFEKTLRRQRERHDLTATDEEAWNAALDGGRRILQQYLDWAPAVDRFWPVRVETDFDVQIPDPAAPGADLVSPAGEPVRYGGRVDLLLVDEHDAYWVVRHRLVERFTDEDLLALDDELVAACWAWELFYLGMRISGTIHNELRLAGDPPDPADPVRRPRASHAFAQARAQHRRMYAQAEDVPSEIDTEEGGGMFRRTRIPRSRAALDDLGRRLAAEARRMLDPDVSLYPSPAPESCTACRFRAPCLTLNEGGDAEAVLAAGYRLRPPEAPPEGRLGAVTWSMNRGAAPPPNWVRRDRD